MPQLMPLQWMISFFFVFMFLLLMMMIYGNYFLVEFKKNISKKIILNEKWLW